VDAIFNDAINGVVAGQFTAQAALDSAAVKVTDLLKKEGW
jgi:ABC-type glycerol-3-phosphate transport system substrate-binding protein